jgi:dihydroorotate dehydrogenase
VLVSLNGSDLKVGGVPDIVNSMGVPSEAAAVWQKVFENIKNHPRGKYVGLSVIGEDTVERSIKLDLQDAIARALEMGPPFIEINISCPNLKGKDLHSDCQLLREICAGARQQVKQKSLLFLKLPCVSGSQLLNLLKACGDLVDAMVFKNTIKVRPVIEDRDKGRIGAFLGREFGGLSGPSTFPLTLRGVREVAKFRQQLGQRFAIVAAGGVQTTADVNKLMEAGASVVQAVTTPMFDPLLALKVRYGLRELRDKTQAARAQAESQAEMLRPRNLTEWMSLSEASQAAVEAAQRIPAFNFGIPPQKWNRWRQEQPSQPPGHGQRLPVRRRIDWFKDFTS